MAALQFVRVLMFSALTCDLNKRIKSYLSLALAKQTQFGTQTAHNMATHERSKSYTFLTIATGISWWACALVWSYARASVKTWRVTHGNFTILSLPALLTATSLRPNTDSAILTRPSTCHCRNQNRLDGHVILLEKS